MSVKATCTIALVRVDDGVNGRVYFMEASTDIIKTGKDGLIPSYLDVSAYYRDGTSTNRTAYAGRFKVEETEDGNTWTTVYTSAVNESSLKHSLYTFIADSSGNAIVDSAGNGIGFMRPISQVRISLYAAGGTSVLIDQKNFSVVKDVEALSWEEIFNLLTNNGEIKGIYKEGNQLYISFTYAKGGKLSLGGPGNGIGFLEILDANGKQIVRGDNGGLSVVGGTISGPEITGGKIRGASIRTMSSSNKFVMLESGMLSFCDGTYDAYNTYGEIKPGVILHPDFPDDFGQVAVISMDTDFVFAVNVSGNREFYVSEYRTRVLGDLEVEGSKARICDTENFGTRKLYAYETPTPYFGDIGSGVLNEDGICYVAVDDIFAETVNCDIEYQVFLQKEGPGDLWVDSKEAAYFVVKGTPNLPFSWEMKVLQKDYEYLRLEDEALGNETISYEDELMRIADAELAEYDKEMEDIGNVEESFESVSDY